MQIGSCPLNVKCNVEIKGGGHFMTINKPEEIIQILKDLLKASNG